MGGGSSPSTVTQKTTNEPPAYLQPYLTEVAQGAQANYKSASPTYFPGQTYAGMSTPTSTALTGTINRASNGNPLLPAAQNVNLNTLQGKYLDPASNPNLRASVDYANQPVIDNYMKNIAPSNDARFSLAGRYGSGAHVDAQTQSQDSLNRTLAGNAATMYGNAYNTERGYQNAAIGQAPALAEADYNDLAKLAAAGQTQEGYSQQAIDAAIAKHNFEQNLQAAKLAQYSDIIRGQNGGGTTTSTQTTPMQGGGFLSSLGQGIGMGSDLASLGMTAAKLFMMSDRRVKEDIKRVGKTDEGTPIYTYRYKWGGPRQMGVMAQDVEKTNPAAVKRHPFGIKMVDYSKVA